ncbi:sterol desaturase family protein [Rossellomorea vietnamensis]|uniref:Sterol desaturase family protein n=1 Tax=Rossellomorea vietnamensis TaxID=218284 RepID=A0A5D4MI84_9BACI|nr:sterol desaturase family protein [Rossellomorea vietnamensis]TYS01287.1 sterol desaturase family protein [Rossellomorea vietnamensis]
MGRVKLLKNKGQFRDFFFHMDILLMMTILIVMVAATMFMVPGLPELLFLGLGLVVFMFSEYLTHRFLFHLKAPENPLFLKFLKRIHYDHHKYPNDLKLLFLPVWYSIPNFAALSAIFYLIFRSVEGTVSFGIGLILMLLVYEWRHFIAHRPIKPKTRFGKWVKKTHTLHHFKNENFWYGVSTPFVDALFGTLKEQTDVETSETVKDLEKRAK